MSGLSSAKSVSQAGAWRGHEPPSPRRMPTLPTNRKSLSALAQRASLIFAGRNLAEESGAGQADAASRRVAFGKRFGRFVPGEQRASRRLCRTLGLPDFGKSPANRGVCRVTSRTVRLLPDPPGGRVRRRVVGGSLPVARLENRSRVACPLPGPVVGRRRKSLKSKTGGEGGIRTLDTGFGPV